MSPEARRVTADLPRAEVGVERPLSFNQAAFVSLQFLAQLRSKPPASPSVTFSVYLDGDVDVAAVRASLAAVVRRHDILRSAFPDPQRLPRADEQAIVEALQHHDICAGGRLKQSVFPADDRDALSDGHIVMLPVYSPARLAAEIAHPFDVSSPPLVRSVFSRLPPTGS